MVDRRGPEQLPASRVAEEVGDRRPEPVVGDEHAGLAVDDGAAMAGDVGGDRRGAARAALGQRHPPALGVRRAHDQPGPAVGVEQFVVGDAAAQPHPAGRSCSTTHASIAAVGSVTDQLDRQLRVRPRASRAPPAPALALDRSEPTDDHDGGRRARAGVGVNRSSTPGGITWRLGGIPSRRISAADDSDSVANVLERYQQRREPGLQPPPDGAQRAGSASSHISRWTWCIHTTRRRRAQIGPNHGTPFQISIVAVSAGRRRTIGGRRPARTRRTPAALGHAVAVALERRGRSASRSGGRRRSPPPPTGGRSRRRGARSRRRRGRRGRATRSSRRG